MTSLALMFPGQGSQYIGMGKKLCSTYDEARKTFEEADDALGFSLMALCADGPLAELTLTEHAQPAILTASVAAYRVLSKRIDLRPKLSAGHSLGEFSALTCAGALDFVSAVRLVRLRGRFMQEAAGLRIGAMSAIGGIDRSAVESACRRHSHDDLIAVTSCFNTSDQTVISGHRKAVEAVEKDLAKSGARVASLNVSAPFHSPLMEAAARKLETELAKISFGSLSWPVLANATAQPYSGAAAIVGNLTKQMTAPVLWDDSMRLALDKGVSLFLEVGPGTALRNMLRRISKTTDVLALDDPKDYEQLTERLPTSQAESTESSGSYFKQRTGGENKPMVKMAVITRSLAIAVCTRNNNPDESGYQAGVIEPYKKIQKLAEILEKDQRDPTMEEMRQAIDMLRSVFTTKQTPIEEQHFRFDQLFTESGTATLFADFKLSL